jgi:hypothetical protein
MANGVEDGINGPPPDAPAIPKEPFDQAQVTEAVNESK